MPDCAPHACKPAIRQGPRRAVRARYHRACPVRRQSSCRQYRRNLPGSDQLGRQVKGARVGTRTKTMFVQVTAYFSFCRAKRTPTPASEIDSNPTVSNASRIASFVACQISDSLPALPQYEQRFAFSARPRTPHVNATRAILICSAVSTLMAQRSRL